MNEQELQFFMRVSELNSISKVARESNVTPSSVSAHIVSLEEELETRLFTRNGKRLQLNRNGEIAYEHMTNIRNDMVDASREIADLNHDLSYGLSISSLTIPRLIPLIIKAFRREYPEIKLSIAQYQKRREIASMNCDVMLYSSNEYSRSKSSMTIYEEPIFLLASRQHPLAVKKIVTVQDIVGAQFIRASELADFGQLTTKIMKELNISPEIAIVSDYPEFVMELISANMGISFQPGLTYQFYYRNQNIVPISIEGIHPVRYINIAWSSTRYYSQAMDTFIRFVCTYLKEQSLAGIPGRYMGEDE